MLIKFLSITLSLTLSLVHGGASVKEDSSDLTHGVNQVICGNPVRALKARQQSIIQVIYFYCYTYSNCEITKGNKGMLSFCQYGLCSIWNV